MPDDQFADEQRATVRMRADGADDSAAAVGRFQYDARFEFRSQLLQRLQQRGNPEVVQQFGFDIQGAVYQEIVRQNTGEKLPFFIAGATKQTEPDIRIIHVTDNYLQEALHMVEMNMPRILRVKNGEVEPDRCELCDCCRHNRVLKKPISIMDLTAGI